jgi:nucleoid DNA-binding protein
MTNGSMTKAELVEEVSRVSDLTKKHSEVIVDTVFKSIIDRAASRRENRAARVWKLSFATS